MAEVRAVGRQLVGVAAAFNTPAQIGAFTETIAPGAFRACLAAGADVRCLIDHNDSLLLGRTRSQTFRLSETARGLEFELDCPDTSLGRDTLHMAERGDLSGCSFGFRVPAGGDRWPARDKRELLKVDLAEVSILNRLPAYQATTVSARAAGSDSAARLRRLILAAIG